MKEFYTIDVAGVKRDLPLCALTDELYIGAFVIFGDVELTAAAAKALLEKAPEFDILLTAESKGIPLVYEMARQCGAKEYLLARKGAQKQDKESAHYIAAAAASSVSGVEAVLRDAHLRSPTNGIVAEIYPAEGELVGIGTPLLSIVDIAKPYAVFNVREDMMPHFRLGQRIRGDVPAIATPNIEWEICYIAPLGSYATWRSSHLAESYDMRTFEVHARPTKHVEGLYPGMSVLLTIENIEQ